MEHEGDCYTNTNWSNKNNSLRLGKETKRLRNQKTIRDCSNYSIIKISSNTEKIPGVMWRLAVIEKLEKDGQLIIVLKILKE